MSLVLHAQVAERDLDVTIDVAAGQTLALLGANGSGKSTTLAVVAGLLRPDAGFARLDGATLFSLGEGHSVWHPPHRRNIGLLAQDPLLFPHLSVLENVAFGPRSRGVPRGGARDHARHWLDEVGAGDLADRKPGQLSGGQAQRVALARTLAAEPRLVLLDEPLSATDVELAAAMRQTLRRVLAARTAIIVTHQVLDAALLSDQIAVVERGRIVEQGPTDEVLRQPRSEFAASLSGVNLLRGVAVDDDSLRRSDGTVVHGGASGDLVVGAAAIAIFRPEAVAVHRTAPHGSPRNHFTGRVTSIEPRGHLVRLRVGELNADITAASVARLGLEIAAPVVLTVKAAEVSLYRG